MFDIEFLIATQKKRLEGLLCQIHIALNSGLNVRVTVGMDGEYPELMEKLPESYKDKIRFVKNVPQGTPSISFGYLYENMDWDGWIYAVADDDIVLPWGLKHLWENREGVSMVIGQTIGVSRDDHFDFSGWKIGYEVVENHVSTAFINSKDLSKLPKPWIVNEPNSDYLIIKRMADHFKYRVIPNVVHVQAFAKFENLGEEFKESYMNIYGHLF